LKEKIKKIILFIVNPKLLLCFGIAWMITNGWAYVLTGLGAILEISWMVAVGGAYLAALWVPFTPEKILTLIISIWLLKIMFPNDKKTLAVLISMREKIKEKLRSKREKRLSKKKAKKDDFFQNKLK
jgi:pheromone shutdown protein TraB